MTSWGALARLSVGSFMFVVGPGCWLGLFGCRRDILSVSCRGWFNYWIELYDWVGNSDCNSDGWLVNSLVSCVNVSVWL